VRVRVRVMVKVRVRQMVRVVRVRVRVSVSKRERVRVMVWVRVRVRVSASGSRFGFGGVWHGTKSFCVEMVLLYAYAWNNYTLTFCKHTYASFLLLKRWKQNRKHLVNTRKQK
jgi:hypothetical protein